MESVGVLSIRKVSVPCLTYANTAIPRVPKGLCAPTAAIWRIRRPAALLGIQAAEETVTIFSNKVLYAKEVLDAIGCTHKD